MLDGGGAVLGAALSVAAPEAQQSALALVGSVDWILLQASDTGSPMITAENILAAAEGTPLQEEDVAPPPRDGPQLDDYGIDGASGLELGNPLGLED